MTAQNVIKNLLQIKGISYHAAAASMGVAWQSVQKVFTVRNDMRTARAAALLNLCGYDLAAVPKGADLPAGSYVIDGKE